MKRQWKGFVSGVMVTLLCVGLIGSAFAVYQKQATLDYTGIKITLNGDPVTPKDANGNVIEPFAIDGTTYLPVRGIASAMGLDVAWDQATQTVNLAEYDLKTESSVELARKEILEKYEGANGVLSIKAESGYSSESEELRAVIVYGDPYTRRDFQYVLTDFVDTVTDVSAKTGVGVGFVEVSIKSGGSESVYWHSYASAFASSKTGDLFDKDNGVTYDDILYTEAGATLGSYVAPYARTLTAGEYVVGDDIVPGKYDFYASSGTGNLVVYGASGKLLINEVFGVGDGYTQSYSNAKLNARATIKISGDLRVKLVPSE